MDELLQPITPSFTPINTFSPPTRFTSPTPELFADQNMPSSLRRPPRSSSHTLAAESSPSSSFYDFNQDEDRNDGSNNTGRAEMRSIENSGTYSVVPPPKCGRRTVLDDDDDDDDNEQEEIEDSDVELTDIPHAYLHDSSGYDAILEEAKEFFVDQRPPFCVKFGGKETKEAIELETDNVVTLTFTTFNEEGFGFWKFTGTNGDKYIVKCQNSQYYAWLGQRADFAADPVARVLDKKTKAERAKVEEETESPKRNLRTRTQTQMRVYEADRLAHNMSKKGISHTKADVENALKCAQHGAEKSSSAKPSLESVHKKQKTGNSTDKSTPAPAPASVLTKALPTAKTPISENVPDEMIFRHTWLRTRFAEIPDASVPVFLREKGVNELLTLIGSRWRFQLSPRTIKYCIVQFPWRDENANILLHWDHEEAMEKLIEEVRHAPSWRTEERCELDLHIHTE